MEHDKVISNEKKLDIEIQKLYSTIQLLEQDIHRYEKELADRENHLKGYNQEISQSRDKMEKLLSEEAWIKAEEPFFGKAGSMYDFKNLEPLQLQEDIETMEAEREELKKKFDPKVEELAKKNEELYRELDQKRSTIKRDKEKLEIMISTFDAERNKDIKATVKEVSKSLGEIFSTLLKGVDAKLVAKYDPNDENAITGLDLKVSFNGEEKESLSELSGGQKSLLALSLILAMLKYQPAPFYILDEIDSALDLSHT